MERKIVHRQHDFRHRKILKILHTHTHNLVRTNKQFEQSCMIQSQHAKLLYFYILTMNNPKAKSESESEVAQSPDSLQPHGL